MRLFYREYGEGKPIIIAHGLFGMSDNWITVAKKLSINFKVYLLDMRNHGKSPHSNEQSYESMSNDFLEFMNDNQIKKATFIGHSMGGKAVMQFAVNFSDLIENIIIVDISPKVNIEIDVNKLNHYEILKSMNDSNISLMKSRKEINKYFNQYFEDKFIIQLIQKNIIRNKQKEFSWKLNVKSLINNLKELKKEIFIPERINLNTLFIFGGNSVYYKKEYEFYLKEKISNFKIKIIKDAGHFLHVEKEKELLKIISLFLS